MERNYYNERFFKNTPSTPDLDWWSKPTDFESFLSQSNRTFAPLLAENPYQSQSPSSKANSSPANSSPIPEKVLNSVKAYQWGNWPVYFESKEASHVGTEKGSDDSVIGHFHHPVYGPFTKKFSLDEIQRTTPQEAKNAWKI